MKLPLYASILLAGHACIPMTAAATATDLMVILDSMCIGTNADLLVIENLAKASGGNEIPANIVGQDVAVAKYGGRGFAVPRGSERYAVIATSIGSCSVIAANTSASEARTLIERNYPLARPYVDRSGPQVTYFYRIVDPSLHAGGYLMTTMPKPGFGADNSVIVGYISESAAKKMRIGKQQ